MAALLRPNCTSRRLITRLSTCRKAMPENSIMSISIRRVAEVVQQRLDELVGLVVEEKGAVEQVHADNPQGLLLQGVLGVEHPHVQDDLAVLVAGIGLEPHAHPAVAFVGALGSCGRKRCRRRRRRQVVSPRLSCKRLRFKLVLVVEHGFQPLPADIALALAVDGVADGHVVGRHALGDGAGGAAHVEEPPHHFLPGADLGERAVAALVEVDGQGLVVGSSEVHATWRSIAPVEYGKKNGGIFADAPEEVYAQPAIRGKGPAWQGCQSSRE